MSCSRILNDYDGVQHDYTRKQGLVWEQVFLPPMAPSEWQDREVLWNAVEENEKTKDSRLAREFVVALPVELDKTVWVNLLSDFIQTQFVDDGMCADVAIHDTDGHNPHAHILLTVRPLTDKGTWQHKTEKEYLCVRNGEEQGFTAAEFKTAQNDGWEKQYQYKVGKQKVWMTVAEAEAHGYERVSKYPKSTKFGRQNLISARWNSEEQLVAWRAAWADAVNHSLERSGVDERVDHRSHAERGLDEQPTIHEGVTARALEAKGIVSDRCELNRQIKADNKLLWELKAQVKKLANAIINTIPAMAEALEAVRQNVQVILYQLRRVQGQRQGVRESIANLKSTLQNYAKLFQRGKRKYTERKQLQSEKDSTSPVLIPKRRELTRRISELTEDLEEIQTERKLILQSLGYNDDSGIAATEKHVAGLEKDLQHLNQQAEKFSTELNDALRQYSELKDQAGDLDPVELYRVRLALRPQMEQEATQQLEGIFGDSFFTGRKIQTDWEADHMLGVDMEQQKVRQIIRQQEREKRQSAHKRKFREWER